MGAAAGQCQCAVDPKTQQMSCGGADCLQDPNCAGGTCLTDPNAAAKTAASVAKGPSLKGMGAAAGAIGKFKAAGARSAPSSTSAPTAV